jgi:hypothetical protein
MNNLPEIFKYKDVILFIIDLYITYRPYSKETFIGYDDELIYFCDLLIKKFIPFKMNTIITSWFVSIIL